MSLSEITDPRAVYKAIEEFDRQGRDAFLAKYGFGKARSYFLVENGKEYDSKAIAGVAHGYQFPQLGSLKASEFSGGEKTVQRKLEELGFVVVRKKAVRIIKGGQDDQSNR